jgi:endonuclease/exonuclease/phosphatase family metal-dependent hydrolase
MLRSAAMYPPRLALACWLLAASCRAPAPTDAFDPIDAGAADSGASVDSPAAAVDATDATDATEAADAPAASDPSRLRVATFNVHRFFDPTCDSGRCAAGDYEVLPSPEAFAQRAREIARAIERLDADVVLLQEVETAASLRAIAERLGPGWPTAVLGEIGTPASVDVAVVSRDPLRAVRTHRDRALQRPDGTRTVFSRELLEVEFDHAGHTVIAFAAHLRSMVDDDPGRRLAEAQTAREIVGARARERPEALLLLGGDLNDVPGSPTLAALESDGALERATAGRSDEAIATYLFRGAALALDHVFRARDGAGAVVAAEVEVRWDAQPARGYGGSDHASLRAVYRW